MRLNKRIADSGIASRRGADELISSGHVRVNGKTVRELGTQVEDTDIIEVRNKPLPVQSKVIVYAFNKPKGVVCSTVKQGTSRIVTEFIPKYPPVTPVGRLDKDSEGLLIFTNDGALTQKLTHPSFSHHKTYEVITRVKEGVEVNIAKVTAHFLKGVKLGDGQAKADAVSIRSLTPVTHSIRITIHEGRHHQIRRMCAVEGLEVTKLTRIQIGSYKLHGIPVGEFITLTEREIALLCQA